MPNYSINLIPWQGKPEWQEILLFLDTIERVHGHSLGPVRILAREIRSLYDSLSEPLEQLCVSICPDCKDVCCERATIWYDFKDILYLYFGLGIFPYTQIKKIPGQGRPHCVNLEETGCLLPRRERPFVCTWYFCPQATALPQQNTFFSAKMDKIKALRHGMEKAFCSITAR